MCGLLYVIGYVIGATLAGQYATNLIFLGQIGWEAGGLLGGLIGVAFVLLGAVWFYRRH